MMRVGYQHITSIVPNQRGLRAADQDRKADPSPSEWVARDSDIDGYGNDERAVGGVSKIWARVNEVKVAFLVRNRMKCILTFTYHLKSKWKSRSAISTSSGGY